MVALFTICKGFAEASMAHPANVASQIGQGVVSIRAGLTYGQVAVARVSLQRVD
jgi:hypothetical protein